MNIFTHIRGRLLAILETLAREGELGSAADFSRVTVEPPRDAGHGELSTNAAMVLAKAAGRPPRVLAELIAARLGRDGDIVEAAVAGPGFINLRLAARVWHACLADILASGTRYGDATLGTGRKVNVEFVSANPTGPMHVGHARGAVFGDVLASLLQKAGFEVCREYYINDAGAQVDALARSVHVRYREALGLTIDAIPEGLYPGDYLVETGRALAERDGDRWLTVPESEWLEPVRQLAIDAMMVMIRADLALLGVQHDVFSSERAVQRSGAVETALATLDAAGLIYQGVLEPPKGMLPEDWEARPQTLFRSTEFGDDIDRPLKKSDGSWTYFAPDIAYHLDKFQRGWSEMIDVLGADHSGYVKRMTAAVRALTRDEGRLDCKICQLVHLFDAGVPVKMSKRAGTFVTLREVVDQVGKDIVRFIMLTRKNDQTIEFDFARVVEQSRDNMVWYVQYAHARTQSVLRLAAETFGEAAVAPAALAAADLSLLDDAAELSLIRLLAGWPRLIESAAETREPHRIAFFLDEVASGFHALWNKGKDEARLRFITADDLHATLPRLALVQATATVIASGLGVFGVTPVMELR